MDRKRDKTSKRNMIHTAARLKQAMIIEWINGRSRRYTKAMTKYNSIMRNL